MCFAFSLSSSQPLYCPQAAHSSTSSWWGSAGKNTEQAPNFIREITLLWQEPDATNTQQREPGHRNIFALGGTRGTSTDRAGPWACSAFCFQKQGPLKPQKTSFVPCNHAEPDEDNSLITSRTAGETKDTTLKARYWSGSNESTVIYPMN